MKAHNTVSYHQFDMEEGGGACDTSKLPSKLLVKRYGTHPNAIDDVSCNRRLKLNAIYFLFIFFLFVRHLLPAVACYKVPFNHLVRNKFQLQVTTACAVLCYYPMYSAAV
jgi:hypothetical protein